jgi:hypothetical protein
MYQEVTNKGTFSVSAKCFTTVVHWEESFDEVWVRGLQIRDYKFIDNHQVSPKKQAKAVETLFGRTFAPGGDRHTLLLGDWEVDEWSFRMTATFNMRNAWRNVGVTLTRGDSPTALPAGAGNHAFSVTLFHVVVGTGISPTSPALAGNPFFGKYFGQEAGRWARVVCLG